MSITTTDNIQRQLATIPEAERNKTRKEIIACLLNGIVGEIERNYAQGLLHRCPLSNKCSIEELCADIIDEARIFALEHYFNLELKVLDEQERFFEITLTEIEVGGKSAKVKFKLK
jgi:hypothetical protein